MITPKQHRKVLKKKPKIDQTIQKGITTATINNALETTQDQINKAKKDLLKPIVEDEEILKLLTTHENFKKLTHRLEHRITLKDKRGNVLGTSGIFARHIETTIQQLRQTTKRDMNIDKDNKYTISQKLEDLGYEHYKHNKDGNLHSIQIKIIFRKG